MRTIVDYFLETVSKYPKNLAVSDERGSYSYSRLDEYSDQIAARLIDLLPEGNHNVGVVLPRRKEALAAFLGIMRSGNCYVFASPDVPAERIRYILQDAGAECVITSHESDGALKELSAPVVYVEDLADVAAAPKHYNLSDLSKPAFMTYTSGSTGNPKGVIDTYYYIANHIAARHYYYEPGPDECLGNIVNFTYAASTYDLYSGLMVGCNLYIFSDAELLNQAVLVDKIKEYNITSMFMIPSMIPLVFAPGAELPIKCIITAGEKAKQIPDISATMVEIYGSSEAAAVTGRVAKPGDPWNLLGRPMPGTTIYLLDEAGQLINTPDTVGEVCIVNDALALGYKGKDEENKAKFVDCPYEAGKRMYKSGDLMKYDSEGNYFYCGRKDNMTKINGQRVEMGEIEAVLVKNPAVEDAVCVICHKNGTDILVCYYIREEGQTPSDSELSKFAREKLPRHMIPLYWIGMDQFPKNVNGKVDRKALPEPDFDKYTENVEPETYEERKLLEVARELLPDISFGVTDNLMSLGMDSIRAVQFVARIEAIDKRITVSDVMRGGSVRAILSERRDILWYYGKQDSDKPTLVLVHGLIPVSAFAGLYECWNEYFNLLLIEPFLDHIYDALDEYNYYKLIDFYMHKLIEAGIENAGLWGFAGFSFGGQIAASLAAEWEKRTGLKKQVIMGDTYMQWIYPGKVFPVLTEDDPYIRMVTERSNRYGDSVIKEPMELILKKQNAVIDLMRTETCNVSYDGPVLYLDTKLDYDEPTEELKISVVKGNFKNAEIMEFSDFSHNDLYMKPEVFRFYRNYFKLLLGRQAARRMPDKHFEREFYKNFTLSEEDDPAFKEKYDKLVGGLDEESVKTVDVILQRLRELRASTDHMLPPFSLREQEQIDFIEEHFNREIKRESKDCFVYGEYKLASPRFEACVFVDKCGLASVDNPAYFADKDIIDAGAFIGDSALIFAGLTTRSVYAFEPTGENYRSMEKTIELNGLKNVVPCKYALGREKGQVVMTNSMASSTNAYLDKSAMPYTGTETVDVITLDEYVKEHGLQVGLIKVDVEGAEQELLAGALETIKTQKPTLLFSIYHNASDFFSIKPILEELDLGYKFKIRHPAIGTVLMETMLIAEVE